VELPAGDLVHVVEAGLVRPFEEPLESIAVVLVGRVREFVLPVCEVFRYSFVR
jgi:hypothetical protein